MLNKSVVQLVSKSLNKIVENPMYYWYRPQSDTWPLKETEPADWILKGTWRILFQLQQAHRNWMWTGVLSGETQWPWMSPGAGTDQVYVPVTSVTLSVTSCQCWLTTRTWSHAAKVSFRSDSCRLLLCPSERGVLHCIILRHCTGNGWIYRLQRATH